MSDGLMEQDDLVKRLREHPVLQSVRNGKPDYEAIGLYIESAYGIREEAADRIASQAVTIEEANGTIAELRRHAAVEGMSYREDEFGAPYFINGRAEAAEAEVSRLKAVAERLETRIDSAAEQVHHIEQWADAYPLDIFAEPDLKKARELLKAGGITLDAVSASMGRHVLDGVGELAKAARRLLTEDSR